MAEIPAHESASQARVFKLSPAGEVVWQYSGRILQRRSNGVVLEAFYNLNDMPLPGAVLKRGDRFVETFFTDRWYNIFEVFDRDDGKRKGWYCNITEPATIEGDRISWVDLALDIWVSPDGTQTLMDEDEFRALNLDSSTRRRAREGLAQLRAHFTQPPTA